MRALSLEVLRWLFAPGAIAAWLGGASIASAQISDPLPDIPVGEVRVEVEFVVALPDSGSISKPTARPMTLVGDGSGRRFVADQNGLVYQLEADDSLSVFLDLAAATNLVSDFGVRGLNSIAFHPDYFDASAPGFGRFYTASSQTAASGTPDFPVPAGAPTSNHAVLHEWQVSSSNPDAIDPGSAREVLRIGEPYSGHPIGQIAFDPTAAPSDPDRGLLFIALGDGGSNSCCPPAIDPLLRGQDLSSPLGTLLRIDPLQDGGSSYRVPADNPFASDGDPSTLDMIWAWGFRNPHRFAFDTGPIGKAAAFGHRGLQHRRGRPRREGGEPRLVGTRRHLPHHAEQRVRRVPAAAERRHVRIHLSRAPVRP
jgi:hypothetical protein